MGSVWGNGNGGVVARITVVSSGRRLASRSSLYSFECAPLAKAQLRS